MQKISRVSLIDNVKRKTGRTHCSMCGLSLGWHPNLTQSSEIPRERGILRVLHDGCEDINV